MVLYRRLKGRPVLQGENNGLESTEDCRIPVGMEINMYACAARK